MRLHIQNPANEATFRITRDQLDAALARAPDRWDVHASIADDEDGFREAMRDAEVLVTWTGEGRKLFPAGTLPMSRPTFG